ncbi:hypothetical protein QE152_g1088 [Popillia japonica]|uniref:Uncharacterized protein n=1 Tax=Popillia japonica TaxID=7064 RepID=A0AAW1N5M5_POPJA
MPYRPQSHPFIRQTTPNYTTQNPHPFRANSFRNRAVNTPNLPRSNVTPMEVDPSASGIRIKPPANQATTMRKPLMGFSNGRRVFHQETCEEVANLLERTDETSEIEHPDQREVTFDEILYENEVTFDEILYENFQIPASQDRETT